VAVAQEALKAEYYLWQLYQLDKDIVRVRGEAGKQKEELNGAAKVLYSCEAQVEQRKKAAAGFSKERLLLERKHKKRKADLEKKARNWKHSWNQTL
jgi:chromosome segregation ATPase